MPATTIREKPSSAEATTDAPKSQQAVKPRRLGPFTILERYPVYRRLWFGALCASLGQWMQSIAMGWLAITLTDSPAFVGLVGVMSGLPFILFAIPIGALIDRVDRRSLLLICQLIATAIAILASAIIFLDWIQPWHVLAFALANGVLLAVLTPTQQSLVPSLVSKSDLTNAIALSSAGQNMTRVIGPSLAGAIIGLAGVGPTLLVQSVALIGAFLLVSRIDIPRVESNRTANRGILDGIRLILRRPDLRALFTLACIPTLLVFPYIQFLPVFARDILEIGPGGLGLLMATSGSGAVVGALIVASRHRLEGSGRLVLAMAIIYGLLIVAVAASRLVPLTLPLLFLAGALGGSFMSINNALLQLRITDDVRGRVMSAYLLTFGLMPLGALPMGLLADQVGTPTAVAVGALASTLCITAVAIRLPILRTL